MTFAMSPGYPNTMARHFGSYRWVDEPAVSRVCQRVLLRYGGPGVCVTSAAQDG